ncbi:MAG: ATP-binding cassette domain-containing protein [Bryobacterales bacterium]
MSRTEAAIAFENVRKSFGTRTILDGVTFEVPKGRSIAILGRSGTGKSVSLKLMIGLLTPDSGKVEVLGKQPAQLDSPGMSELRKRMGFLFQNSALFDSINVFDNIAFPLRRNKKGTEAEIRERVETLLAEVQLPGEGEKMPSELSGGMKKRAALARALAMDPEVLLVDEPSAGLDPITSEEIDDLLESIRNDASKTLVVVTHNMPSARRLGHELLFLDEGKVLAQGPPEELEGSSEELVQKFLSSVSGG